MRSTYILLFIAALLLFGCKNNTTDSKNYFTVFGFAQGTTYKITYHDKSRRNLKPEIEDILQKFEKSLSVYDSTSIISRVNRNEDIEVDDYFVEVFNRSAEITKKTNGAFDISGEPLFLAWGFSRKNKISMDSLKVDSLMQYVGMDKIRLEGRKVVKTNPNVIINGNAIAKGYSTDIVAKFLDSKDCKNYMVEIGGEMKLKGKNTEGKEWRTAIDTPIDGNYEPGADVLAIIKITDKGLATSGNYRRFYIEDGKKIGHTINPKTGYPVSNNLLSCTVIANDCLTADAFASAFLVVGIDSARRWVQKFPELDAYFIYDDNGVLKSDYTKGLENCIEYVQKKQAE